MASSARRSVALIVLIGVLLPVLAGLQYRWLGELSGLEELRARSNLEAAAARFSTLFDAQLAGVYAALVRAAADGSSSVSPGALGRAISGLASPGLVKALYVVDRTGNGPFRTREIDVAGRDVRDSAYPTWLGGSSSAPVGQPLDATPPQGLRRTLIDEVPAIVVPLSLAGHDRWVVAVLDLERITHDLLPAMLAACFEGGIPTSYDVLIVRDDMPEHVVYQSRAGLSRAAFDSSVPPMPVFAIHGRDLDAHTARGLMPDAAAHRWRLLIQPQRGALEAAIGAVRLRNLAVGAGVLGLLALSVGLLVASMHATQRAARDQLELVARMSHELRTPLATITCAGENLADRVVGSPIDTQYYGELITGEGRRLTKIIGDILLCCRLQARPDAVLNRQPTDVADVIERAVAETLMVAGHDGVRIDKSVEASLPVVLADQDALRMALKNLLINAVKYGSRGGRDAAVRIAAKSRRTASRLDVVIVVEDEGPGIPPDELSRIFEPFYRGRGARTREIEGSGIGLSIVQQVVRSHGGRIRVASVERQGTTFTVNLPASRPGSNVLAGEAASHADKTTTKPLEHV